MHIHYLALNLSVVILKDSALADVATAITIVQKTLCIENSWDMIFIANMQWSEARKKHSKLFVVYYVVKNQKKAATRLMLRGTSTPCLFKKNEGIAIISYKKRTSEIDSESD